MLKEEGRAGLLYAYDPDGKYTRADYAKDGSKYTCPVCKCPMHLTSTKTGKKYFARNPHTQHTNPICITKEKKKEEHSFEGLDPVKFIISLCQSTPRKKGSVEKPGTTGPGGGTEPKPQENPDDGTTLRQFSSLKQIAESGIDYLNPNDMQGDHKVSEYIMTYKYAEDFFTNPDFELGARIVYARYSLHDNKTQSLIFTLFIKNKFAVKFRLLFTSSNEYRSVRDKFVKAAPNEKGRTTLQKTASEQNVLIACDDWYKISKPICNDCCLPKEDYCKTCIGMFQAQYTNSKQLYLLPADQ